MGYTENMNNAIKLYEIKNLCSDIDSLITSDDISWGILQREGLRYIEDKNDMSLLANPVSAENRKKTSMIRNYMTSNHIKLDKRFINLHETFLQPGKGVSSFYDSCNRNRKRRNVKTRAVDNNSYILSKDRKSAFARFFFEIEEDFDEMEKRYIVNNNCGYTIVRKMYNENISTMDDLESGCLEMGSAKKTISTRIEKLIDIGAIIKNKENVSLADDVKCGFDFVFSDENAQKLKNWKYRINWFLPTRKI